ncbi:PaaI family thioesterase [Kiritimatiellaeota bacterium B1221]|nr:PaaI family thioesterase [Kiritimatiellaeota bacterium B1221]
METAEDSKRGFPNQNLLRLETLRQRGHGHCMAYLHPVFKLNFSLESDQVLLAELDFTNEMTSFNGMVHGGLQSFLIDQAMTCALMGIGVYAATCELKLRYRASVEVGVPARIRVWVSGRYRTLYDVEAELWQAERIRTQAHARFFEQNLKA